jgi:hypothetical protein
MEKRKFCNNKYLNVMPDPESVILNLFQHFQGRLGSTSQESMSYDPETSLRAEALRRASGFRVTERYF